MSQQNKPPDQDPAEGSRAVIDRELQRHEDDSASGPAVREKARRNLERQVKEETELPQKGSA